MKKFDYDVGVVGGGSGGYAAARTAAGAGLRTVVIEGGKEVGGLCILRGCMPTKALLYAAEVKHLAQHPDAWGIQSHGVTFDFAKVMARKDALVKEFADYRVQQLNGGKFKFIRARARFTDAHTLALSNGKTLTAKNFVISTGSVVVALSPALPENARLHQQRRRAGAGATAEVADCAGRRRGGGGAGAVFRAVRREGDGDSAERACVAGV